MPVSTFAKAVVAIVGAIIVSIQAALEDGIFTGDEWFTIVVAAVTAVGVYLVPNKGGSDG